MRLSLGNRIDSTIIVGPNGNPSNLVLTVIDDTRIKLDWTDGSTNEDGFKIERSPNGTSSWAEIASVLANVVTYTNTGLTFNTKYYYRVRAYKGTRYSEYTTVQNATTLFPELVTSLVNGTTYPYETFVKSGVNNITSAINSSGSGSIYDNAMNLTVAVGDKFRLKFDFVLNSGQSPTINIMTNGDGVAGSSTNNVTPTTGSYNVLMTVTAGNAGSGKELTIYNSVNSNWSMTNISLRKEL